MENAQTNTAALKNEHQGKGESQSNQNSASSKSEALGGRVIKEVKDVSRNVARDVKDAADDSIGYIRDNVSTLYGKGQKMVQEVGHDVEAQIKNFPLRTLAIAAGVGFALAFLPRLSSKMKH